MVDNLSQANMTAFKFSKLSEAGNYRQWERNMINAMKSAELYGLINETYIPPPPVSADELKALPYQERRDYVNDLNK